MVHRDPETGQFLAHDDDEPVELTYADHEFLNFRVLTQHNGAADSREFVELDVEDDVLDLENDELGMLAYMTGVLTGVADFDPNDEDAGSAQIAALIGSNLAGTEYLNSPDADGGVQVRNDTGNIAAAGNANDEPGLWAALACSVSPPYVQSVGDASGGGTEGKDRLRRVYHEETMGGPYIDATDDVTVGISIEKERTDSDIEARVFGQMAFVVFEYENRRAEFAPYDPGPSMD